MATITAAAGGGNWNVGSTWNGGIVPLTTDDVVLNATSGQVTITATAQCVDINFTGYTNTITFNANLTITGDLTRSASVFSYAGTGGIIIAGTTTQIITTTSVAWTIPVTFGGASPSISINGAFNITAPLTLSSTTSPVIARANVFDLTENVHPSGNITISSNGTYTGSANIVVSGSNNQTLTASGNHQIRNNLTIDKTGGVLTLSGTLNYGNPSGVSTLTYVASGGTVNAGSSTLNIGASATLNTNGITWNNVSLNNGTITLTLTSDFNISGTFTASGLSGALTLTFAGVGQFLPTGAFVTNSSSATGIATITITLPNDISVSTFTYTDNSGSANRRNVTLNGSRNITVNGAVYFGNTRTSTISGTCTIIFAGNSGFTVGGGGVNAGVYSIPVKIDNGLNTCTFAGSPVFTSTTVTYTSGTITGASCFFSACTLNLNAGGQWGTDVTIRGATTLTSNATFGNLTTDTTAVSFTGAFTVNVKGNLAINITTSGASTPIVINGTGSQTWSHGSAVYLSNNLTINKASGTLTIGTLALPNVYYQTGTLTYIQGDVDTTTNNSTLNLITVSTLNTNGIIWNNVSATSGTHSIASNFYCNNFSSSNSAINFNNTGGDIYLYKSLTQGVAQLQGTATIYFVGGVTWNQTSLTANHHVKNNIVIDTSETVTFGSYVAYSTGTLTYKRGKVNTKGCTFSIQTATTTLINCNKINFHRVVIDAGLTVIMNEFFNGSPELQTIISSTSTTNYTIAFTDNFEKIAKFVNTNGITFTRPQQLLLLTNQPKKSRNIGIRYNNDLPNGISKGDPSVQNLLTVGQTRTLLLGDPAFVKSI
jgi:hypothetical protein